MTSRRDMLAVSSGLISSTIAGCLGIGGPDGQPIKFGDKHIRRHDHEDELDIVAREQETLDEPEGTLRADGRVYEWQGESLYLYTSYQIETDHEDKWAHTRYFEEHDWSGSDISDKVVWVDANFAPAENDQEDGWARGSSSKATGQWDIELKTPSERYQSYIFTTWTTETTSASAGDTIAVTTSEVTFSDDSGGIFSDDDTNVHSLDLTYTYGDSNS